MPRTALADRTDPLRRPVHQSRVSEAGDRSPQCGAAAHRSGGTRRPRCTPQPADRFRTIASDRVDDTEPSVAQHERILVQSAAHLVALRRLGEAAPWAWQGRGFDGISGSEAVATSPRPTWRWGSRQNRLSQRYTRRRLPDSTHALHLTRIWPNLGRDVGQHHGTAHFSLQNPAPSSCAHGEPI